MKAKKIKPEAKVLHSSLLKSDPSYQRPVDMKRVNQIVKNYNPLLVNPVKVSLRDGDYFIFDGQHSVQVLKIMAGGVDTQISCLVYRGLTQRDEAILFAEQNGISKPVGIREKTKAKLVGHDEDAMKLVKIIEAAGFELGLTGSSADNRILAISKVEKMYKNLSPEDLLKILTIIKKAWNGDKDSLSKEMLGGMYELFKIYKGQFNEQKLIEKLSEETPLNIIRDGKALLLKGDKKYALKIVRIYNYKNRFKLDERQLLFN